MELRKWDPFDSSDRPAPARSGLVLLFFNSKTGSPCVVRRSFPRHPSGSFEACNVVFTRMTRSPCVSGGGYYLEPEMLRHKSDFVRTAPYKRHTSPDGPGSGGNLKSPERKLHPAHREIVNPDTWITPMGVVARQPVPWGPLQIPQVLAERPLVSFNREPIIPWLAWPLLRFIPEDCMA